jgi:type II secretory pathway pseudopilin PulG
MYKVIGTDAKEYGPVSEETLRAWLAQNRLNLDSRVQAEDTVEWKRLGDLPQFAGMPGAVNPPTIPPAVTPAPLSRMAIASLILGLLGLLTAGLAAIPGLILGIIALVKISRSQGRLEGTAIAIAGIAVSAVFIVMMPIMAAMLLPALARAKSKAQSVQCLNNVKQLNLAIIMYADDYQGKLPSPENWCDLVKPYLGGSDAAFKCGAQPNARCSYAFNASLAGRKISDVPAPAETILVFSSDDGWNQSGGEAVLEPHRHGNIFTYGCADGHAEVRRQGVLSHLKWDVPGEPGR